MPTFPRTLRVLVIVAIASTPARATNTPTEDGPLLRPFRLGVCAGLAPDCFVLSGTWELAHRYVGVNLNFSLLPTVFLWGGGSIKVYPGGAVHRRTISLRPYLFAGYSGSNDRYMGGALPGGGLGADIHLGASKKAIVRPAISWVHRADGRAAATPGTPIGGSLSLMQGF